ncbi:hypothetical protein ACLI1A_17230 [Flavobacterium sp. RHBU_3]|uniref:hypothetical protein n=1 Tax=Flavobacterium sp. RHBU_3 TaxID=3391184 RepID=UPI00398488B7
MKKLLTLLLLWASTGMIAQQQKDSVKTFLPREYFKIYAGVPTGLGDNALAKSHHGQFSIGLAATALQYHNFQLNAGLRYTQYKVEDHAFGTTASNLTLTDIYGEVVYKQPINNNFIINPQFFVSSLQLNTGGAPFEFEASKGKQYGCTVGGGFDVDFVIEKHAKIFIGAIYSMSYLNTNTAPELEKFYNRLGQLNIIAGYKF